MHLPVFRPEPSKTVLSHISVLFSSSGGFPDRGVGAHTNTCTHRPKSYALASLRAGPFENGVFSPPRPLSVLRGLSRGDGGTHKRTHFTSFCARGRSDHHLPGAISFRFVARGPSDHHLPGAVSLRFVARGLSDHLPGAISIRFVARGPSDHRARGFRKQPKVAHLPVYGPGASENNQKLRTCQSMSRGHPKTTFSHHATPHNTTPHTTPHHTPHHTTPHTTPHHHTTQHTPHHHTTQHTPHHTPHRRTQKLCTCQSMGRGPP